MKNIDHNLSKNVCLKMSTGGVTFSYCGPRSRRVIIFQGMGCFVLDLFFLRLCIDRVFDPSLM